MNYLTRSCNRNLDAIMFFCKFFQKKIIIFFPLQKIDLSVEAAIHHLNKTLGHIEFTLGLQNIQADDHKMAATHFKSATSHHHAGATFNLGVCYELGIGVEINLKSAMECYRAASQLGHKKAMYNLGVFYVHGIGGLKKSKKAARACFIAADKLGLQSARVVLDIPTEMRKADDEICLKSNKVLMADVHEVHKRSMNLTQAVYLRLYCYI